MKYKHLVEFKPEENKIAIYRILESGGQHLYTEIPIARIGEQNRTLEGLGRLLGQALILDMNQLRDRF
jgi:hypothetical protein